MKNGYIDLFGDDNIKRVWPYNLLADVLKDPNAIREKAIYVGGLEEAMATLTEREQAVLKMRYRDGQTLEDCGFAMQITRERVRQVQAKALAKLRHPTRMRKFVAVKFAYAEGILKVLREAEVRNEALSAQLQGILATLPNATREQAEESAEAAAAKDKPITLGMFGTRAYYSLKRAGMSTLGDIAEMTADDLRNIRSMGRITAMEVCDVLHANGLKLKGE